MTIEDIRANYLNFWQRELRLDHWDIECRFANVDEIQGHGQSCAARYHRAQILLRPEADRCPDDNARFRLNYEVIIVHELIHIKESQWRDNPIVEAVLDKDEWIRRQHEDSLDAIAEALVRARRGIVREVRCTTASS